MKKSKFTESQIVGMLKEYDNDNGKIDRPDCRDSGISKQTFYKWKSRIQVEVNELKRMRELEEENLRLKKMYGNLSLDHSILKGVITKKAWSPARKNSCWSLSAPTARLGLTTFQQIDGNDLIKNSFLLSGRIKGVSAGSIFAH